MSVVTSAEWASRLGSKVARVSAINAAGVPNHSRAAKKISSESPSASNPAVSLMRKTSRWLAPSLRASQSRPSR